MKRIFLTTVGLVALGTAPALAADLPARSYSKAPAVMAPVNTWTGFYLGAMGGYAQQDITAPTPSGGLAGGTIGYNWQSGQMVYGLEADGAWADVSATATGTVFGIAASATQKFDAMGTVRGRIGVAFDQILLYGTGGYAWIDDKVDVTALGVTVSESHFHNGWTAGAGIEAMVAPKWSVKAEYLYRSLAGENFFGVPTGDINLHTFQVGVNYHF
jgi:outer membrane immunogenic protein